jgi:C-terminal processing protease CtpA/Prc
MKHSRIALALLAALALLPLGTSAQTRGATISINRRGWLGISYNFSSTSLDGRSTSELTVVDVVKDSPADRAGVKSGDHILRIDGRPINEDAFTLLARRLEPGDAVRLRVSTGDRERDVTLVATDRPTDQAMFFLSGDSINKRVRIYLDSARAGMFHFGGDSLLLNRFRFDGDSMYMGAFPRIEILRGNMMLDSMFMNHDGFRIFRDSIPRMWQSEVPFGRFERMDFPDFDDLLNGGVVGAEFTPINEGLGSYFGTDKGLLVVRVGPGTAAARAGLQSGDVITKVDGRSISEVNEFRRAVVRAGNETLKLEVLRKGKARSIELEPRRRQR